MSEPVIPVVKCATLQAAITADSTVTGGLTLAQETVFDTSRVQSALSACTSGQAVELAPSGAFNAFLIQPITIPAGVTLLVDAGVRVMASRNPADYNKGTSTNCGSVGGAGSGCQPLISINNAPGAAIMGYGAIDGRGGATLLVGGADSGVTWWDNATGGNEVSPVLLNVSSSANVTLYRITFQNSPHFHVTASSSNNMILWGTKIITPYDTGNTDGFDPGGFNNTTVQDAYFSDGDDEIALTGGSSPLTQNMTVNNAHFFSGHGMSIGSHTTYGISNLLVNGLTVNEVAANGSGTGLRIKSDATSGGLVQNVTYQNVCMQNVSYPIVMTAYYTTASGTSIPQYRNINFTNVHALTAGKVSFVGYDGGTTNGITDVLGMNLNNVVIDGITAGQVSSQYTQFALGPGPVNFASYLAGVGDTVTNNVSNSNAAYSCPVSAFNVLAGEIVHGPSTVTTSQNVTLQAQILTPRETSYASYLAAKGPNPATTLQLVAPTGTVSLMEGSTVLGTATLSAAAEFGNANTVSINIGTLSAGMHTITGSYSGDANYLAQTFGNYSLLVTGGATTTTTLGASGTALIPGQSVTFTALVTASSGTPTGTVMFFDGSYPLATSAVNGTGAATYTTTSLSNISHTITAVYSGDTAYGTSTSNAVVVAVTQASSAVTFTANPTTVTMGQPITFTASVAPANGSSTDVPTGNMAFKVNGKTPSNQQLVNGTIQWTVVTSTASFFAVGSNTTFGSYGGDTNFASAASPNLTITINAGAATTTTLNASATSIFPGQTVMLMAGVSSTTAGTETGTFSFFDGTTLLGTVALGTGTGNATTAQFSTSSLAVGAHSITAVYNGDSVYGISTSTATVVTAALAPTTLALSSNANGGRTTPGQSVTFTAALSVASGGTPTGSITFYDGLATLAVVTPVSGTATLATMGLSIGAHTVTASYGGDANYGASQASSVYVVVSASGTGVPVAPVLLPQVITTIAGNGTAGTSGDGGPASAATLSADLRGLAADGFGTVYIGDAANSRVRSINALSGTIKLFAGGGTVCSGHTDSAGDGCIALQMTGFKPRGIATDKLGALYIAGYTDNLVHRIDPVTNIASLVAGQVASVSSLGTAGNGADGTVATSAALNGPRGAWVDNLGNVFIADVGNRLVRMVYNAGTFTGLSTTTPVKGAIYTVAGNTTSTITDNGLATASGTSAPQGVYVDNQQNIFIPDVSRLRVVYEGGTTVAALIAATNSGTTATAGYIYTVAGGGAGAYSAGTVVLGPSIALGGITKIAADANGNLYLGDGGKNEVWFFDVQTGYIRTVAGGAATVCGTATDTIGDGCLGTAATLNVGSSAQAVAMDAQNNLYVTDPGNARLRKVSSNLSFAATAVGGTLTQAVVVHLGAGETGATFALPQGLTDFTVSGTPACVANADTTRDCTVQVVFAPAAPGFRTGQITVTSNPSGAAKTFALSGTGTGPKLVLNPGTAVALGTGLTPQGVAVDAAGNVYVANKAAGTLLKFAAGSSTPVTLVSGLSQPFQVTVDGTGNIYVADSGNNRVVAVSVAGVVSAVGTGLNAPRGVAVDSAGDVYIADTGNSRVVEVPAAPSSQVMIGSGFSGPTQLAVDAANNLYVLDQGNSRVVEIAPGASTQPVLSLGSILPVAIAVDAAADVYVADAASESVLMYAAGSSTGTALATGLSSPAGLAVNGSGTVYLADAGATAVTVLGRAAGTLTFANTSTPVSAVLTNVGNSSLSFTAPGFAQTDATDFSVAASSSGGCAFANGTLGAGASCGVTGIFSPQTTGTLTDVVTLASSGGAPVLTLSGSGTVTVGTTTTVSAPTPGAPVYGQSVTFTATVAANSGSATPTGSVVFTVDSTSGSAVTLSAGQAASASFAGLTAGTHSIAAVYTPTGAFAASSSSVGSFTVAQAAPVLNWSPAASVGYGTPLSAVENANSGGLPGVFAYTATVSGGSPVAITANSFLPVGTYALGVTFTPTDSVDYATATASVPSLTIVKAATTSGVGPTQNVVAVDGSGNFATLAAAIAALPAGGGAIYVRPGTYTGQNLISKSNVQLRGLGGDPTKVVLAGSQDAQQTGSDQASATLGVTGSNFYMETIYVNNTFQADNPTATGNTQSVALYLSGDKDVVYNSQIMARQDTLYANNGPARQYFYADKISGNVDYIFGDAAAVFDNCNIYSVYNLTATGGITITAQKKLYAANSAQNYLSGYVITNSTLTNETDLGTPTNLLYGRPWGPYSTTVFINNSIQTLNAAGWSEFTPGVTNYLPTSTYAEYGNYGPTYTTSGREQYATFLTASAAAAYAPDTFLGGTDGWSPTAGLKAYIASVVPTATSLTITPGASVTMVARVAPPALGVPTGTLTFYDGAAVLTSMALDALGEGSYTTSALANGTHSITVVYSGDSNFTGSTSGAAVVTAGTGSLTTLQMGSTSLTYGQGTTATATISPASGTGVPTGSVTFSLDGVALTPVALSAGQATLTIPGTTAVGSHVLIAAYGGDASYSGSTATAMNFTVAKAVLTVTGNSPTMVYGGSVPALSAAITGFVNSETSSVVSGSATVTTTATSASAVGSYPVTPAIGTLSATNYSFTFVNGSITVTKAAATVTVANATKAYGAALPSFTATAAGLVNGDALGATLTVGYSTGATTASAVGSYPVNATVSGTSATNYTVTVVPGSLSVTAVPLTVTVANATKAYGAALPSFTSTAAGLVNGDALGTTLTPAYTTAATAASAVGSYAVNATVSGASAGNYTVTVVPGSLSVTAVPLTVTVANATKAYGAALPSFTSTAAGLVNGDALGTTLTPAYTTAATAASAVGSYAVNATVSGASAGNYTVTVVPGSLSVTAVPLTVTVANATKAYGAALPSFTSTATGLVNGDALGATVTVAYTTTATASSAVGSYAVNATAAGTSAGNYSIAVVPGTLTVTTATTVTGLNASATTVTTGTSVTLTATVTSAGGVPTGTVTFLDGTTTLGSSVLNAQGVATLATTGMVVGTNPVTASYAGDASFAASVSAATTITGVVPPSFSLSVSPTTLVITSGSTGAATITFTPVGGYTGTVTLSCGSLPANVYCTFTPLTLTANGSNTVQTSTLSIATNGVAANHMPGVAPMYMAGLMMLPLGLLLLRRRRVLPTVLLMVVGLLGAIGVSGCGGSPSSGGSHNASPGTSTVVVTASVGGSAVQTVNLTVTIQ